MMQLRRSCLDEQRKEKVDEAVNSQKINLCFDLEVAVQEYALHMNSLERVLATRNPATLSSKEVFNRSKQSNLLKPAAKHESQPRKGGVCALSSQKTHELKISQSPP